MKYRAAVFQIKLVFRGRAPKSIDDVAAMIRGDSEDGTGRLVRMLSLPVSASMAKRLAKAYGDADAFAELVENGGK
jgi:hypothetical protein